MTFDAFMSVPKTTMYHYNSVILCKDDIRLSRKSSTMDSKTQTFTIQISPNNKFRPSIFRLYLAHYITTLCNANCVQGYTSP